MSRNQRTTQIHAVAERRYGDACALRDTNHSERASGAIYLAGLAIEIALKARLLAKYPWLSNSKNNAALDKKQREISTLFWRLHDLAEMAVFADAMPRIRDRGGDLLVEKFKRLCSEWSVAVRYESKTRTVAEAAQFVSVAEEIKECLRR